MIGYDKLLKLRRLRVQPSMVVLTDGSDPCAKDWHEEVNAKTGQYHAHVQIGELENPDVLDLRAVVGLAVLITGQRSDERTRRLFGAVVQAKPLAAVAILPNESLFFDSRVHG